MATERPENDATTSSSSSSSSSSSLRQLLAALAAGARAVQGLPTSMSTSSTTAARNDAGHGDDDDDIDSTNVNNNQFAFESSFPEFSTALQQATGTLMETLTQAFASLDGTTKEQDGEENDEGMMISLDNETSNSMMQDPLFWEQCADACDLLVEQVEAQIEDNNITATTTTPGAAASLNTWKQWSAAARRQSQVVSFQHMQQRLVDMEKPQVTYHIAPPVVNNDRHTPFMPRVDKNSSIKPHGFIVPHYVLTLQPGHGLETAGFVNNNTAAAAAAASNSGGKKKSLYLPDDMVAPSHHVPHLYAAEIQQFTYQPWQLEEDPQPHITSTTKMSSNIIPIVEHGKLAATWIDTPLALNQLHDKLMVWSSSSSNSNDDAVLELAMDLEAHSFRSFAGLVCLMQISIRKQQDGSSSSSGAAGDESSIMDNYLIDTLKLHDHIHAAFADVLANPRVCKVLHGADSDISWLQRDFGLYVVNLFDTGRAARALNLAGGAGYANLLSTFVVFNHHPQEDGDSVGPHDNKTKTVVIDKSHQLSDWRQRPLPHDMQQYAIQDTHYLLDIAQRLRIQLYNQGGSDLMRQVLDTSRQVCLIRYAGVEPFKPSGYYTSIICSSGSSRGRGGKTVQLEWTPRQQAVCKVLWDWRDATARRLDESIPYICSNRLLSRLSMAMPSTVQQVQNIVSSSSTTKGTINGIVQQQLAPEVVECIQRAIKQFEQDENNSNKNEEDEDVEEEMQPAPPTSTTANVQSSSSAFFKPSSASKERQRRGMMSPVLGTEALYKQAGWMTPKEQHARSSLLLRAEEFAAMTTTTSTSDDEEDELEAVDDEDDDDEDDDEDDDDDDDDNINKPRRLLSIQTCNKNYNTERLAERDLKLADSGAASSAPTTPSRGRSVDGMATVRAAREAASQSPIHHPIAAKSTAVLAAVDQDAKQARKCSEEIRSGLHKGGPIPAVLGLLSSSAAAAATTAASTTTTSKHGQTSGVEGGGGARVSASKTTVGVVASTEMEEEEFVIPRSMREIYKISNRNRRNKKASSPTPENRGVTPTSEKEREELAQAEALLKERGFEAAGYLFDNGNVNQHQQREQQQQQQLHSVGSSSPGKRAKTKSGRDSEESVPQEATGGAAAKEDLDFMRGIRWIASEQSDDSIMAQRYASNTTRAESTGTTGGGCGGDEASTATRPTSRSEEGSHRDSNRPASSASGYTNYDYSQVGPIGAMQPPSTSIVASSNPFFSGTASGRSSISPALQGGPLNQNLAKAEGGQQQQRTSRKASGGNNNATNRSGGGKQANRKQQERPEKKDGRTHAYRSSNKRP